MSLPLQALAAAVRHEGASRADVGYGPLRPVADDVTGLALLQLPEGFRYVSFGWTGDVLDDGAPTPAGHDGMAAFAGADGTVHLMRNHELLVASAFAPDLAYDRGAGGGVTTLRFDPTHARLVSARVALSGTLRNCAGGPTPWGSWLTCEESVLGPEAQATLTRPHGYVFEVPGAGDGSCLPLVGLGRFVHEAVAIDPATGIVYQTEDAGRAGLYRYVPRVPGRLPDGGRLQMLAVKGRPRLDLRTGQLPGRSFGVAWVDIDEPDRAFIGTEYTMGGGVFEQGARSGGATFARLEGAFHADGRIFVTSTNGGDAKMGQVWELLAADDELRLIYESPGAHELNMPDNLTVSPRGGLVLCEDGTANPCVHGLSRDGRIVRFARNNTVLSGEIHGLAGDYRASEFAGATFSPDGRWLFLNIQNPGITVAITGPWERGPL